MRANSQEMSAATDWLRQVATTSGNPAFRLYAQRLLAELGYLQQEMQRLKAPSEPGSPR